MSQDLRPRIGGAQLADVLAGEALVHFAAALPGDDADIGLAGDIAGEELVGDQDHLAHAPGLGRLLHHLHGVGGGAADVGLGLHLGAGVHIGDDRQARVARLDQAHIGGGDGRGEAAARLKIGDQHGLVRAEDL